MKTYYQTWVTARQGYIKSPAGVRPLHMPSVSEFIPDQSSNIWCFSKHGGGRCFQLCQPYVSVRWQITYNWGFFSHKDEEHRRCFAAHLPASEGRDSLPLSHLPDVDLATT